MMRHRAQGFMTSLIPLSNFASPTTARGTIGLGECWQIAGARLMRFCHEGLYSAVHIGVIRRDLDVGCYYGVKKTFQNVNFSLSL